MKILRRTWQVFFSTILPLLVLAGLVFALGRIVYVQQPSFVAAQQQRKAEERQRTSQNDPPPAADSLGQSSDTSNQGRSQQQPPHWYQTEVGTNWVLAIISGITFVVVAWQAWETRKAVTAARDGIAQTERHFALLNAQWIDLSNFHCERQSSSDDLNRGTWSSMWWIRLTVSNPTPLPITVLRFETYFDGDCRIMGLQKTIGPRQEWTHPIFPVGLVSAESDARLVAGHPIGALLIGRLHYRNALGKDTWQPFAKRGSISGFGGPLTEDVPGDLDDQFMQLQSAILQRTKNQHAQHG